MENKNESKNSEGCACGGCASCGGRTEIPSCMQSWGRGGRHHHLIKLMILLAVILFVFWAGVKIGELKSVIYGGWYGSDMMRRGYGYERSGDMYAPRSMMRGWYDTQNTPSSSTTPPQQ